MTRRQFITGRWSKGTMAVRPSAFPRFISPTSDQRIAADIADRLLGRETLWGEPGVVIRWDPPYDDTYRTTYLGISRS